MPRITLWQMISLHMRSVPISTMWKCLRLAEEHHLPVTLKDLEMLYLCGRDPMPAVRAFIELRHVPNMTFDYVSAYVLARGVDMQQVIEDFRNVPGLQPNGYLAWRKKRIESGS